MIFVDTNVLMYAVGGAHPLRDAARSFFEETLARGERLVTSAEVLQELLHAYLPVNRLETLDAAPRWPRLASRSCGRWSGRMCGWPGRW